jgi:hypothetical protein
VGLFAVLHTAALEGFGHPVHGVAIDRVADAPMSELTDFDEAVRNFLATVRPGERIETLALATTLIAELEVQLPIEEARAIIRAEATPLGVEWWDER